MDIRSFLYLLKTLSVTQSEKLNLRAAAKVVTATIGFAGDCERHQLDFEDYCEALARCCDVQTHDGVVSLPEVTPCVCVVFGVHPPLRRPVGAGPVQLHLRVVAGAEEGHQRVGGAAAAGGAL